MPCGGAFGAAARENMDKSNMCLAPPAEARPSASVGFKSAGATESSLAATKVRELFRCTERIRCRRSAHVAQLSNGSLCSSAAARDVRSPRALRFTPRVLQKVIASPCPDRRHGGAGSVVAESALPPLNPYS